MNSLILFTAMMLNGPPAPTASLIIGLHDGTPRAAAIRAEFAQDPWINSRFNVTFQDEPFTQPRFRFARFGEYTEFPHPDDAPNGAWCTRGMAMIWVRPVLEAQLNDLKGGFRGEIPEWSLEAYDWERDAYRPMRKLPGEDGYYPPQDEPIPLPAPAGDDHVAPVPPSPDEPKGE